jgi:hypothetical protein
MRKKIISFTRLHAISIIISAIFSVVATLFTLYITYQNHKTDNQLKFQEINNKKTDYSNQYTKFWDDFSNFYNIQVKQEVTTLKDIGHALEHLKLLQSHLPQKKYLAIQERCNDYDKLLSIKYSFAGAVPGDLYRLMLNQKIFIVQYKDIATTLKIRGWDIFVQQTMKNILSIEKLIPQINESLREIEVCPVQSPTLEQTRSLLLQSLEVIAYQQSLLGALDIFLNQNI